MMPTTARVRAAREQLSSDLDGKAVILEPSSGQYYGLDEVGTRIWKLIQEAGGYQTVNEIRDALVEEYEVAPEDCERDLLRLLEVLKTEGLIEVEDAPADP